MKYLLANLGVNLVALSCVSAAAWLAIHDKPGWGWFLFGALVCAGSASFSGKDTK